MDATPAGKHMYADELYLHVLAGRMLFPRDEANFSSYLCLGIGDILSSSLKNGVPPEKAFPAILTIIEQFFSTGEHPDGIDAGPLTGFVWDKYQYYIRNARFPEHGKGSIEERAIRGRFAGLLLNLALTENLSLTEAATRAETVWNAERSRIWNDPSGDPLTMTATNFMQNIWPDFKASAHLWAALQDFSIPKDVGPTGVRFNFFRLSDIVENSAIMAPNPDGGITQVPLTTWPSKFVGWRALVYKSNHILKECTRRGNAKGSTKPLLVADECWQFSLPDV